MKAEWKQMKDPLPNPLCQMAWSFVFSWLRLRVLTTPGKHVFVVYRGVTNKMLTLTVWITWWTPRYLCFKCQKATQTRRSCWSERQNSVQRDPKVPVLFQPRRWPRAFHRPVQRSIGHQLLESWRCLGAVQTLRLLAYLRFEDGDGGCVWGV